MQQVTQQLDTVSGVFSNFAARFVNAMPGILTALVVLFVFYLIARIGKGIIAVAAPRVRADTGVVLLLSRVFYYGVLIFGLLTAMPLTGLDVSALIAGVGLTGFAVGFALKDVLSNLLAGIMLLLYRPFNLGDHIKMGEHEGTIQTIRMRDTVLRTADGRLVIIPNTKLMTEVVVNHSTLNLAEDSLQITLPSSVDLGKARELIQRTIKDSLNLVAPQFINQSDSANEDKQTVEPMVSLSKSDEREQTLEGKFFFDPRRVTGEKMRAEIVNRVQQALASSGINAKIETRRPAVAPKQTDAEDDDAGGLS